MVTKLAAVPLDAPTGPGVPDRQIARLEHRVTVDQLAVEGLVVDRCHLASDLRKHRDAKDVVLQHNRPKLAHGALARVAILHAVRQDPVPGGAAQADEVALRDVVGLGVDIAVILGSAEHRQGVFGPYVGRGQNVGLETKLSHRDISTGVRLQGIGVIPMRCGSSPPAAGRPPVPLPFLGAPASCLQSRCRAPSSAYPSPSYLCSSAVLSALLPLPSA